MDAATLEMVREGQVEVHQQGAFAPIYLRKRAAEAPPTPEDVVASSETGNEG